MVQSMGQQMMPMGMNPMMAMNPMMMNPMMMMGMMGMSQMMGMMMGQQQAPATSAAGAADLVVMAEQKTIDPRVKALCQQFQADEATERMLHEAMLAREDYDEDIQALQLVMERDVNKGKKPAEALRTQVRCIKANRFAGKDILDPQIWEFAPSSTQRRPTPKGVEVAAMTTTMNAIDAAVPDHGSPERETLKADRSSG